MSTLAPVAARSTLMRLLALLVLGVSMVSCQSPAPRAPIGMTVHFRDADTDSVRRQFDLMAEMGVTWVRVDIDWSVVEPERGRFDWTYPDMVVEQAAAREMNVLAVLAFSPPWARPSTAGEARYSRPEDLSQWADFTRMTTQRYAPKGVHTWEIWNEPNTRKFWPPGPDVNEYGTLFWVAADAVREVDPEATVLIGGLGPQFEVPEAEIPPTQYLEALYANGAAKVADGIAAHPYSFPALPMDTPQRMVGGFKDLPALRAVMEEHGDADKQIWITEFGAPTGTGPHAVSDDDQAATLVQAREQAQQWDWAGPLIYYELVDGGTDLADPEQNFGVLRTDLTPKPAAQALLDMAPAT